MRSETYPVGGTRVLIRVARSEMGVRHELTEFSVGMALGLPAAVLLACLGGYFLAGRALKPVGAVRLVRGFSFTDQGPVLCRRIFSPRRY